jgi:pimeloyl-ACP methyl ester carboxylesterase
MKKTFLVLFCLSLTFIFCSYLTAASLSENLIRDKDGDRISDAVEISLGLNPLDKTDGVSDADFDGLSLADEINAGTNPNKVDSDDDGISDFDELENAPTAPSSLARIPQINRPTPPPALSQKPRAAKNWMVNSKITLPAKLKQANQAQFGNQVAQWVDLPSLNGWEPSRGTSLQVWQLDNNEFLCIGNGIKQPLKNLGNGSYILKWKHRQPTINSATKNYQVKISTANGQIIHINNFQPESLEQWEDLSTEFRINSTDAGQRLWLSLSSNDGASSPVFVDDIYLLQAGFNVDLNRDGKIGAGEGPRGNVPFYFWINNDNDSTEFNGNDWSTTLASEADFNDQKINSLRDLVDFFPVSLNFSEAIKAYPPDGQTRYILSQADGAVNIVFTGLNASNAGSFNQKINSDIYGDTFNQPWSQAEVHPINPSIELSESQILRMLNNGEVIIMIEGRKETRAPLVFKIEKDGKKCLEVSLPLHLDDVERMYRHLNLRDVVTTYDGKKISDNPANYGRATEIEIPTGLPDSQNSKKYFVFVHGFHVNAQQARGWNNEMFKRFYVSGSQARFVGVTWRGDTAPDYHEAVFRSLQTGDALAKKLLSFVDGPITLAGHSLGNAVVGNTIQRGNLSVQSYLAINAAIPAEAYSSNCSTLTQRQNMTELNWRKYDANLYASYWNELFPASDTRSKLTWRNQFNKSQKIVSNFYSGGDEVIAKANSVTEASIVKLIFNQGFNFSDNAWKYQELIKGLSWYSSVASVFMDRRQAGWAFNDDWWLWADATEGSKVKYTPSQARTISNSRLIAKPFFDYFSERETLSSQKNVGSLKASEPKVIYDLLARGIPAMTYATGVMSLNDQIKYNYDLELLGRSTTHWPTAGHEKPSQKQRWLHSDIKNVALPIIYPTFQIMVSQGLLK